MKRFLYIIVFCGWYLLSLLPLRVLYLLSDLLYPIVYYVVRYRRDVAWENLTLAFPDKSEAERRAIERKHYRFFCDYIVEMIKQFSISPTQMKRRMEFRGLDEASRELADSDYDFAFVYLGHYCNWEWITSLGIGVPPGIHAAQIYHPLSNPHFDKLFLRLRGRFKAESITMNNTLRRILQLRREGKKTFIGFISDQLPKWGSIHYFVPFLGQDTAVFTGAEQIGRKMRCMYFYGEVERPSRGHYVCTLHRMHSEEAPGSEYPYTAAFTFRLDKQIKARPELWLWTHKRWKRTKVEYDKVAAMDLSPQERITLLMGREWQRDNGYQVD